MRNSRTYQSIITAGVLSIMLTSCGGSKNVSSRHREKDSKPEFEHEILGNSESNWEVTDDNEPGEEEETSANLHLEDFIEDWKGTPHVMGGNTKKGVDCSGFVIQAYLQVYNSGFMGRRAEDLFGETTPIKRRNLEEGDLVFFKINGRRIDHVGIYLSNDNFVHVSSSRGVMVSNLNEAYFDKRFFMGGRKKRQDY